MRLSAKMLKNVANVNHFQYEDQVYILEGSTNEFYFRLVDLNKLTYGKDSESLPDHPLRYIPAVGATIEVEFDSLFDDEKFTVNATQPFPEDRSIWKVQLNDDQLPRTGNFIFTLTEGTNTKRVVVRGAISVELNDVGGC
jgi:hypothetical protein